LWKRIGVWLDFIAYCPLSESRSIKDCRNPLRKSLPNSAPNYRRKRLKTLNPIFFRHVFKTNGFSFNHSLGFRFCLLNYLTLTDYGRMVSEKPPS